MEKVNYNPVNSFHQRLRDLPRHEWEAVLAKLPKGQGVYVSGRKVTKNEFYEMMKETK